eukprot:3753913-Rhodomonas_salina.1
MPQIEHPARHLLSDPHLHAPRLPVEPHLRGRGRRGGIRHRAREHPLQRFHRGARLAPPNPARRHPI